MSSSLLNATFDPAANISASSMDGAKPVICTEDPLCWKCRWTNGSRLSIKAKPMPPDNRVR